MSSRVFFSVHANSHSPITCTNFGQFVMCFIDIGLSIFCELFYQLNIHQNHHSKEPISKEHFMKTLWFQQIARLLFTSTRLQWNGVEAPEEKKKLSRTSSPFKWLTVTYLWHFINGFVVVSTREPLYALSQTLQTSRLFVAMKLHTVSTFRKIYFVRNEVH